MAYEGKYRDSFPLICAAGLKNRPNFNVRNTLREYTLNDGIDAFKTAFHVPKKEQRELKFPKIKPYRNPGIFTEAREVLCLPVKTRYQTLLNDLKESVYKSYWDKNLGTTVDSVPAFPEGKNLDGVTFGIPYKYEISAKDLIQPPKTPYQVLWDSQINHDAYKKIYGSYNPSERIDRGYISPPYNPNQRFGKYCGSDKRGFKTKCCMEWFESDPLCTANAVQSDWMRRSKKELGKAYEPNKVLEFLPKNISFGKVIPKDFYTVEDLMRNMNAPVPLEIKDLRRWISSFNRLKFQIDEKKNSTFDYNVLYGKMKFYDQSQEGKITFSHFLKIMRDFELFFDISSVKALFEKLNIIVDDQVDYEKFLESMRGDLKLEKLHDIPRDQLDFISTYQAANCDLLSEDININRPVAGLPSRRHDERKPSSAFSEKYVQLSDYTDVKACLQPSIFTQYSLSHREFFTPRDQSVIRKIFDNMGYKLSDENFAKLWKIATERDKNENVCVQTFRDLLKEYYPIPKTLDVDENFC